VNLLFDDIAPKYSIQFHFDNLQRTYQESFDLGDDFLQPDAA
jgi:hypothetical protein